MNDTLANLSHDETITANIGHANKFDFRICQIIWQLASHEARQTILRKFLNAKPTTQGGPMKQTKDQPKSGRPP